MQLIIFLFRMVIWIMNALFCTSCWYPCTTAFAASASASSAGADAAHLECSSATGNCIYTNVELIKTKQTSISGSTSSDAATFSALNTNIEPTDAAKIQMIAFTKSTLTHVPIDIFNNFPNLRSLDLTYCGIQKLLPSPDTIVQNATSLQRLQLSHNNVTNVEQIRGFDNLTHLEMSYNQIARIHVNAFEWLGELKILDLSHNLICHLSNDTFRSLVALETLMMDFNLINVVSGEWFKKTKRILFISFTHNLINRIPDDAFTGLDDLFHLRLSFNKLTKIDMRNIDAENLDIDNNSIRSLFVNRQLKVLRVDAQSNLISKVRCDQNPKILGLILTNNSLSELGCISKMRRLEMLYLGQNLIRYLDKKAFVSLVNLVTLSLENNEIEYLEPGLFEQQLGLRTLILSNNRLKLFNLNIFASINVIDAIHMNGNNLTSIITDFSDHAHGAAAAASTTTTNENLPAAVENIRQTLPRLSVVDLSDNDWHCSYLAALLHAFEKAQVKCLITTELHVNEINVKGIRCTDGGQSSIATRESSGGSVDNVAMQNGDANIKEMKDKISMLEQEIANTKNNYEIVRKRLESVEKKIEMFEKYHHNEEF